jgi:hypothetical protein
MRSLVLRALRSALVLGAAGTVLACAPLALAETVIYDRGAEVQRLLGIGPPGLSAADGLIQQQPAKAALAGSRQAWKVSGGAGTRATPSIVGIRATRLTAILKDRIWTSSGPPSRAPRGTSWPRPSGSSRRRRPPTPRTDST